jgi:anti-sigma factor RsiW
LTVADTKRHPDDADPAGGATEELVAYLDGELDAKATESLATQLSLDPKLRAEADALQRAWAILDILPRPQPSAAFATRTVSQVIPVPLAASGTQVVPLSGLAIPAMASLPAERPGPGFWILSTMFILLAAIGGYFSHKALAPTARTVSPDPPLEDVMLMKNLRLYRHVDDVEYLKKLDAPETFGDELE